MANKIFYDGPALAGCRSNSSKWNMIPLLDRFQFRLLHVHFLHAISWSSGLRCCLWRIQDAGEVDAQWVAAKSPGRLSQNLGQSQCLVTLPKSEKKSPPNSEPTIRVPRPGLIQFFQKLTVLLVRYFV